MSWVRQAARRLGKSGVAFLIALLIYLGLYLSGHELLSFALLLVLIPLAVFLSFRALRFIKRHSLWSVRNRLLFVYGLMGVLPILLLFVLVGVFAWGLTNDLAIYLASTALDRRLDPLNGTADGLSQMSPAQRNASADEMQKAFKTAFPGITFLINDSTGVHRYPPNAPAMDVPAAWKNTSGLLVWHDRFYGWAHRRNGETQVTALVPLSDDFVEDLVPNLGLIALFENIGEAQTKHSLAAAGSLTVRARGNTARPDWDFTLGDSNSSSDTSARRRRRLPPAMGAFDFPVFLPSSIPHSHLESPNKTVNGLLLVYSRPSAVLSSFFSRSESVRGTVLLLFVTVAALFLLVELVAVFIGVSLSHRLTSAVNQLYEGTRRVLLGDFRHRIPVRDQDQLGELSESFNQMTSNLERLFVVEKEKERLQTELEIAREVQNQLYPREAPPTRGLKLTVCCDPARMVSGDYYDYQEMISGKMAFAIGDVAGKGISAALLMATLQAALRAQISPYQPSRENEDSRLPEIDTSQVISKLNKQIYAHTSPEKYATFFFAMYDEKSRALKYTNAGHLSPLLFTNGEVVSLDSNGTVVGAFPFAKYDQSCLTMKPDDLLVCYTDGITEPENPYGEEFGEKRLIDLVQKHKHQDDHEILRIILEAVKSWTGTAELYDDMTLLLAREVCTN